jgi:hypothetical protein
MKGFNEPKNWNFYITINGIETLIATKYCKCPSLTKIWKELEYRLSYESEVKSIKWCL